jgi:hypothetical protein
VAANNTRIVITAQDNTRGPLNAVKTNLGGLAGAARSLQGTFAALGVGLGAGMFARMISSAIDAQDELGKMSQKVGVSVEALAGLSHAADLSDVSIGSLQKGLKTLSTQMFDASMGLAESKRNFAALGIEIKNTDGTLKASDVVLEEVADRFAELADGPAKAALAVKLFGKAGLDLIPLLNQGSKAIADQAAEGRRLNPVTAESARQAELFNDSLNRLGKSFSAIGIRALNDLLPVMSGLAEVFAEDALAGDLDNTKTKTDALNKSFNPFVETLRAVAVLGSNVSFVFKGVGTELGGMAAQLAALGRGDFKGFAVIRAAMIEDANKARADFDAWEKKLMDLGTGAGPAAPPKKKQKGSLTLGDPAEGAKALKEAERLRKLDADGWVKHIEAMTAEYEDGLREQAKMADDFNASQEAARKTQWEQVFAEIDADQARAIEEGKILLGYAETTTDEMTEFWKSAAQSMQASMSDLFFDVMQGNLSDLSGSFKKTIDRMVADMLAAKAATALFGKGFGQDGGSIGGLVGKGLEWLGMPKFASGGAFTVGGAGGTDSQLVRFMATPGERVSVQTPAQQAAGGAMVLNLTQHFSGAVDRRSASQAAAAAGEAVQRALARNT